MGNASSEAGPDGIDRIARTRNEHDISRIDECDRNMPDTFLRADQRENFVCWVERDMKAACVPIGYGFAERQHALIRGILMVLRVFSSRAEAFDDRHRRRQVRVADAEIDDVDSPCN